MNKLEQIYKEKENQEAMKQVNVDLLKRQLNNADYTKFGYKWFLKELRSYIDAIEATNEKLDDIYTELDKEIKPEEF